MTTLQGKSNKFPGRSVYFCGFHHGMRRVAEGMRINHLVAWASDLSITLLNCQFYGDMRLEFDQSPHIKYQAKIHKYFYQATLWSFKNTTRCPNYYNTTVMLSLYSFGFVCRRNEPLHQMITTSTSTYTTLNTYYTGSENMGRHVAWLTSKV